MFVHGQGVIFGIPLATIVPALCYLKVADGSWFEKYSLASVTILIMGSIAFVFGCYETITQVNLLRKRKKGQLSMPGRFK